MRIDRRRKGLPIRLRALDELNLGRVALDRFLEATDLEPNDPDVEREEQKSRGVSPACPEETTAPFLLPNERGALFPPGLRRKVQLHGRRRHIQCHQVGALGEDPLNCVAQRQTVSSKRTVGNAVSIPCNSALKANCGRWCCNCSASVASSVRVSNKS